MFKIMKGVDKIGAVGGFSRVDSVRIRCHRLMVKKMRVKTVLRQGSFSQRGVNVWNCLPGKLVAAEGVDKIK